MPDSESPTSPATPPTDGLRVAIIGAGISGICAAIRLDRVGFRDIVILEKADRVGGTWRDNTYPGAACDIPAHLYCFSFAPNGGWSRKYAGQAEILEYVEACARRYSLMGRIRFGANVVSAEFDESGACWRVTLQDGATLEAEILIAACGQLHHPHIPEIKGRESFRGVAFHSARWRHDCDLSGKSVALVGSAASAVQIAPEIVDTVATLTIFQRSANWIAPRWNHSYPALARAVLGNAAPVRRLYRGYLYFRQELLILAFRSPGIANRAVRRWLQLTMKVLVRDRARRRRIRPGYPPGCKRILLAPDYLRLMDREDVSLVTDPIERITADGIETADGQVHAADVIVYATGFNAANPLAPIRIVGTAGTELNAQWSNGPSAYLGMAVPGFPNFFVLYGPNTNLGHNSIIFMIERQCEYVARLLTHMRATGARYCGVRPDILTGFVGAVRQRLRATVWSADCTSYYKTDTGNVVSIWPFSTLRYWARTRRPRLSHYLFRT